VSLVSERRPQWFRIDSEVGQNITLPTFSGGPARSTTVIASIPVHPKADVLPLVDDLRVGRQTVVLAAVPKAAPLEEVELAADQISECAQGLDLVGRYVPSITDDEDAAAAIATSRSTSLVTWPQLDLRPRQPRVGA